MKHNLKLRWQLTLPSAIDLVQSGAQTNQCPVSSHESIENTLQDGNDHA